jgi:hypothetical protein
LSLFRETAELNNLSFSYRKGITTKLITLRSRENFAILDNSGDIAVPEFPPRFEMNITVPYLEKIFMISDS